MGPEEASRSKAAREEYDKRSAFLLREFARVADDRGPAGTHYTAEARSLSFEIKMHAENFRPEWYPPAKTPKPPDDPLYR